MWFGSAALGIANFKDDNSPMTNVYTEDIDTGDFVYFVATTLEICGTENDVEFYRRYVEQYECYAFNGVEADDSSIGAVQSIEIIAQPVGECLQNIVLNIAIQIIIIMCCGHAP